MPDDEVFTILAIVAFGFGVIFLISGIIDLSLSASFNLLSDPSYVLEALSRGGTGALKVTIGLVLILAVIAPNALKVIVRR